MATRCIYCGSPAFGTGCTNSPNKCHCHSTDQSTCMYCGQTVYGSGCRFSPTGKHKHGHCKPNEIGKCRYCGSPAYGSCGISPSHYHEH